MSRGKKKAVPARANAASLIDRLLLAFEQAKHIDDNCREYWLAREYAEILGYKWQNFEGVMERGKAALSKEGMAVSDHFTDVGKMVALGSGAERDIGDVELTRQACYFVGINGDPRKKDTIAAVQRYFVEQTRKQEIQEMVGLVGPDRDRLEARKKLAESEAGLKKEAAERKVDERQFETVRRRGHHALFNKSPEKVKEDWDIPKESDLADRSDPLIVKGMDLATSLTARQLKEDEKLKGVGKIGDANAGNHKAVRGAMTASGAFPEKIAPVEDIKVVQQRLERQRLKLKKLNNDNDEAA